MNTFGFGSESWVEFGLKSWSHFYVGGFICFHFHLQLQAPFLLPWLVYCRSCVFSLSYRVRWKIIGFTGFIHLQDSLQLWGQFRYESCHVVQVWFFRIWWRDFKVELLLRINVSLRPEAVFIFLFGGLQDCGAGILQRERRGACHQADPGSRGRKINFIKEIIQKTWQRNTKPFNCSTLL